MYYDFGMKYNTSYKILNYPNFWWPGSRPYINSPYIHSETGNLDNLTQTVKARTQTE